MAVPITMPADGRASLSLQPCVWRGEWDSVHSLAVVNEGVATALEAAGHSVHRAWPGDRPLALDAVGIAGQWPPSFEAPSDGPFVLYQPWEFGRVPAQWAEEIRRTVDEVWTPSEYCRRAYIDSGIAPELVHVMPNGVDVERFRPDGPCAQLPTAKGTVLLFVGGLIYRKGIDLLLEAYGRAFSAADDVSLVVKGFGGKTFYAGQTWDESLRELRARPGAPELVSLDEEVAYGEMPALYRAADVLVQPYRGEGFCLPALEALACGVPVIVTSGGPTDEFVSDACAWRLPSRRLAVPRGAVAGLELVADGFLLEPDADALVDALREAADPAARAARAATAREHAERLSWERVAAIARSRLEALTGQRPIRTAELASVQGRRRTLFVAVPDWARPETWAPALRAYAQAFSPDADTTLVLPAADEAAALALVSAELEASRIDPDGLADVILAGRSEVDAVSLELAADAVICANGHRPRRARLIVPPDPAALRAVAETR